MLLPPAERSVANTHPGASCVETLAVKPLEENPAAISAPVQLLSDSCASISSWELFDSVPNSPPEEGNMDVLPPESRVKSLFDTD